MESLPSLLVKILALVLLGLIIYYAWIFVAIGQVKDKIGKEQQAIADAQAKANAVPNREQIYTRQAQLQQLDTLVANHPYWSQIFPALAKVTLKKADYSTIQVSKEGELTMTVSVPSLQDIDKFLQVFDQPEFNKNFNNLRMGSFHKVQDSAAPGQQAATQYTFDVKMNFNPALLRYQPDNASSTQ